MELGKFQNKHVALILAAILIIGLVFCIVLATILGIGLVFFGKNSGIDAATPTTYVCPDGEIVSDEIKCNKNNSNMSITQEPQPEQTATPDEMTTPNGSPALEKCGLECCQNLEGFKDKLCQDGYACKYNVCSPFCGDGICQPNESMSCLDCPVQCGSTYCNGKIDLQCTNCTADQSAQMSKELEYDTLVYDCLANYFQFTPPRMIPVKITLSGSPCEGIYCETAGLVSLYYIERHSFSGIIQKWNTFVTSVQDQKPELHEMTHVFSAYMLGDIPSWLNEGISIQTNGRLKCSPDQLPEGYWDPSGRKEQYALLKSGDPNYKYTFDSHKTGEFFFVALEEDYGCGEECALRIIKKLREYREQCTGQCFENASRDSWYSMAAPSSSIGLPVITNKVVKQIAEQEAGHDLTSLFDLLQIDYSS